MIFPKNFEYELIECGNFRRIEKFGNFIINRPCPQASWEPKIKFSKTTTQDAFFVRERFLQKNENEIKNTSKASLKPYWENKTSFPKNWEIKIGKIRAQLKLSENGQIGIFPEQVENWFWIQEKIKKKSQKKLKILNLFAYTGIATLFASTAETEVCHVDAAASTIKQAQKNADLSGLSNNKIRWICDDVQKFLIREIRRGAQYDGIILDPPAFGRSGKNSWKIEKDLPKLMNLMEQIICPNPIFLILTCHASDIFSTADLVQMLTKIPQFKSQKPQKLNLEIFSKNGNSLPLSFGARIEGNF